MPNKTQQPAIAPKRALAADGQRRQARAGPAEVSSVMLTIGGVICALNFYLSFVHVPVLRWRGRRPATKRCSGFPLIGSVLVVLAWIAGLDSAGARVAACVFVLIDTGGPHWFVVSLGSQMFVRRGGRSA
jgi:hypothetical protein